MSTEREMANEEAAMGPPWTVLKLLEWSTGFFESKGVDSPRLDAEILLADVLGIERIHLYVQFDRPMKSEELDAYRALVKRRAMREPVAYIVGTRGFWTLDLKTDARALVPRPDTEVLVEEVLKVVPEDSTATLVDVGTGTGAIALAIASERPSARILATDASAEALALARENAEALGYADRVEFFEGDLLDAIPADIALDFVVSNPPYIAESERDSLEPEVAKWEPAGALFADDDGLAIIRRLAAQAHGRLEPHGWIVLEHGYRQGAAVRRVLSDQGFSDVRTRKDYGNNDRVTAAAR